MKRINSMLLLLATFIGAMFLNACLPVSGFPPLPDGGVTDPLMGMSCAPPGDLQACAFPCWSDAARGCLNDGPHGGVYLWTGCTRLPTGHDTCTGDGAVMTADGGSVPTDSGLPDTGSSCAPSACTTVCGNLGVRLCTGGVPDTTCTPSDPALETCGAADAGTDAGPPPPVDAGSDAGPPVDAGTDSGPAIDAGTDAGSPAVDAGSDAGTGCSPTVCTTPCGFLGALPCVGGVLSTTCLVIDPALETCSAADAGVDSGPPLPDAGSDAGSDSGMSIVDAGTDAFVAPVDAGTDAFVPPVDGGTDSGMVLMMDAGSDAGPVMMSDAGTDSGPASTDAGSDAGTDAFVAPDSGTDAGSSGSDAGMDSGTSSGTDSGTSSGGGPLLISISGSAAWCPSGGTPDIRVFDHNGNPFSSHRTLNFSDPGVYIYADVINVTVYCTFSSIDLTWDGYVSPILTGSTLNTLVSSGTFTAASFYGRNLLPEMYNCWDTRTRTSTDFHRAQLQLVPATDPLATSCYATTGS